MSDWKSQEERAATPNTEAVTEDYRYRWSYGDQTAFEQTQKRKKKRRGALVYAVVITAVFAVCIGLLVGLLAFYGAGFGKREGALTTSEVAELINPATVLIYATGKTDAGYGTGFFIRQDGYIATNYHVVASRETITVTLYSGEELEAKLVGYSEVDDLAVLRIKSGTYPVVAIGDSNAIAVGDAAIAIGNPSGATGSWTTTQGIISALDREVTVTQTGSIEELTMIQTDAPVNPGNSGGPLCNDRGEVIGIVTRKLTDYEGIGLAIPINGAMEILTAIVETGTADGVQSSISKVRPTIGINVLDVVEGTKYTDINGYYHTADKTGVAVVGVEKVGTSFGKLEIGDIITAIDGTSIQNQEDLKAALYRYRVGDRAEFTVWRNGKSITVRVILGKAQ